MGNDIRSLGEDARKTLDVSRLIRVREWSRYHDESEWSLIIGGGHARIVQSHAQ